MVGHPLSQLICGNVYISFIDVNRMHARTMTWITHLYCRIRSGLPRLCQAEARRRHDLPISIAGDWVGRCHAESTSVRKICPSIATEMLSDASRKHCTKYQKEM
jgi:hypothetical protein